MLLKKKNLVQKSFRLDQRMEFDVALLAELTNRSQNDLVNLAIEEFLKNNGIWFVNNVIVEHYSPIFKYTGEEYEPVFEMGGVTVELKDEKGLYNVHYTVKKDGRIVEDYEKAIPLSDDNSETELEHYLRFIASFIDTENEEVKQYLKERLDYSDFDSISKKK